MLATHSGFRADELPEEAAEVIKECGYLPLAIAAIGSMLKGKPASRWQLLLKKLRNAQLDKIPATFNYSYQNLFRAFHVSVSVLPIEVQACYQTLVIFPEDKPIPESVLELLWNFRCVEEYEPLDIIDQLVDASLLTRINDKLLSLHDLLRDYLISQSPDIPGFNKQLIDAYEAAYPSGWYTIPVRNPNYFHNNWTYHVEAYASKDKVNSIADELIRKQPLLRWPQLKAALAYVDYKLSDIAPELLLRSQSRWISR